MNAPAWAKVTTTEDARIEEKLGELRTLYPKQAQRIKIFYTVAARFRETENGIIMAHVKTMDVVDQIDLVEGLFGEHSFKHQHVSRLASKACRLGLLQWCEESSKGVKGNVYTFPLADK